MAVDIDALIRAGLTMKEEGCSGKQVKEFLEISGLEPQAVSFVLDQIAKAELKKYAAKDPGAYAYIKGFLGGALMLGGAWLAWYLWTGMPGVSVISTVPAFMMGGGLLLLTAKE